MDKLEQYRKHIKQLLSDYAGYFKVTEDMETEIVFDTDRDRYLVVHIGWENHKFVYGCVLHLDIKNDKIWIQYDGTEIGFANELVRLGVPKTDIVLAYHSPRMRQYNDFAVR
ncbi:MAG: XisI protein [Limnospira sp.]